MRNFGSGWGLGGRALATVALGCAAVALPRVAVAQGSAVGTMARPASVETTAGAPVDLGRYIGKGPVLMQFWAVWCSTCKALEPKMRAARAAYGTRVRFVGVAVGVNQSARLVERYSAKHKLPFEVFYDKAGDATDKFAVPATSYIVALDAKGKIVYTGVGPDQDIDAAVRKALSPSSR